MTTHKKLNPQEAAALSDTPSDVSYEAARPDDPIEVAPVTVPRLVREPSCPRAKVATSPLRTRAKMNRPSLLRAMSVGPAPGLPATAASNVSEPSRPTRYEEIVPLAALVVNANRPSVDAISQHGAACVSTSAPVMFAS